MRKTLKKNKDKDKIDETKVKRPRAEDKNFDLVLDKNKISDNVY